MIDSLPRLADPRAILAALGSTQAQQRAAELNQALLVLAWLDAHPGEYLAAAGAGVQAWHHAEQASQVSLGSERAVQPAGDGTPLVAEFCLVELATALECSAYAARRLAGDLLELRHRLPGCWRRVVDLDVPLWRARRVAQATLDLTPAGAAHVDDAVASRVHTLGAAAIDRAVTGARWRHDPDQAQALAARDAEARDVRIFFGDGHTTLTADVAATLDHLDAVDLERAIAAAAEALAAAGSTDTLSVRRAKALGVIARGDTTLTFPSADPDPSEAAQTIALPPASREVVLHVHLSDTAIASTPGAPGSGRGASGLAAAIEQGPMRIAPVEMVRAWCGADSTTRITVRPVLDPGAPHGTDGYAPSGRLVEQVLARDTGCVFPGCGRPARSCDLDHIQPHSTGGTTSDGNLAPLCRLHHRAKTHGRWRYQRLESHPAGAYEWTSPHRQRFLATTRPGHPPETRRLADLHGGRDGPLSIRIDPPAAPSQPSLSTPHACEPDSALGSAPF